MGLYGTRRALLKGKRAYSEKVLGYSPIAYWPLWEVSGTTAECLVNSAQNGTYTGVTLANALGPDGSPVPFFDGANDYVDVFSTTLRDALNGTAHTIMIWIKVTGAADWSDGLRREAFRWIDTSDSQEYEWLAKDTAWWFRSVASSVIENIYGASGSPTGWVHLALTRDESVDEVKVYVSGTQFSTTRTGLGAWGAEVIGRAVIGAADTTPNNPWKGWLSHVAAFNGAKTQPQIADLAST